MKLIGLVLFVGLFAASTLFAQNKLSASQIEFEFVSKGVDGTIKGFQSESSVVLEDITKSVFKGSVDVKTIKTGIFLRDWSLKGKKYFNVDAYPKIFFESTRIRATESGFEVEGRLTLKGTSKTLSILFKKENNQLVGTTTLNSTDFGITIIKKRKEDNLVKVRMVLHLE